MNPRKRYKISRNFPWIITLLTRKPLTTIQRTNYIRHITILLLKQILTLLISKLSLHEILFTPRLLMLG